MVKPVPKPEPEQQHRPSLLTATTLGRLIIESIKSDSLRSSVTFLVITLVLLKVTLVAVTDKPSYVSGLT